VHAAPVDNEEALHRLIVDICQTIRNCPGIFERIPHAVMGRVEACIQGGYLNTSSKHILSGVGKFADVC
jgi:hypothetical protein